MNSANMDISILEDKPFSLSAFVDKLTTGGINLDTISFKARQDSARLLYGLHIGNKSGNLDQIASLGFNGYITDNHLRLRCLQRTRIPFRMRCLHARFFGAHYICPDRSYIGIFDMDAK